MSYYLLMCYSFKEIKWSHIYQPRPRIARSRVVLPERSPTACKVGIVSLFENVGNFAAITGCSWTKWVILFFKNYSKYDFAITFKIVKTLLFPLSRVFVPLFHNCFILIHFISNPNHIRSSSLSVRQPVLPLLLQPTLPILLLCSSSSSCKFCYVLFFLIYFMFFTSILSSIFFHSFEFFLWLLIACETLCIVYILI